MALLHEANGNPYAATSISDCGFHKAKRKGQSADGNWQAAVKRASEDYTDSQNRNAKKINGRER
jgi:hypothetical protein